MVTGIRIFPSSLVWSQNEDGAMSVGWHSDDESLFQGKLAAVIQGMVQLTRRRFGATHLNFPQNHGACTFLLQRVCVRQGVLTV